MTTTLFLRGAFTLGFTLLFAQVPSPAAVALPVIGPLLGDGAATADVPTADSLELTPESIAARRAVLQQEIARTRDEFEQLPADQPDATSLWLTQEIVLLGRLDGLHAEQLRTLEHAADLAKESAETTARTQNPRPPAVRLQPPHGLLQLDQLYDERDYLVRAESRLETDVENATIALADARDELDAKDRLRRTARQAVEKTADSDTGAAQGVQRLAELESRHARESVLLGELAVRNLKLQQSLLAPKLALVLPDLAWLHEHLEITPDELAAAQDRQDQRLAEIDAALEAARETANQVARLVVVTERRAAGQAVVENDELESRRADRQTVHLMLSTLSAQRERLAAFAEVRELRRRTLTRDGSTDEMKAWAEANRTELDRLQKTRRPRFTELRKSRSELQDLRTRLATTGVATTAGATTAAAADSPWVADRVSHLAAWIALNEHELADVTDLTTARDRLQDELDVHVNTLSVGDTLTAALARLRGAWDYELFSVTDQPVRVKTLFAVIALIVAGHWVSRRASALVGRAVFHRLGMNTGRRAAWQTLSFYGLFLIVILMVINLFHFSLTQFSVISGALAVGIGFGSQNLIGNFISGIILLVERPVNQGDVIEINGRQMTVESVGPRSTLVRSRDNTHTIVPNSRLLEENVINLTLSDDVIRTRIQVGVAYGSPTREVERLLIEVMNGLKGVIAEPAPRVVFAEFGDSSLNFEAMFWSGLESRKEYESELRHRIAESFAAAGILMAFPQRDVHLDTDKPLKIELCTRPEAGPGPATAAPVV